MGPRSVAAKRVAVCLAAIASCGLAHPHGMPPAAKVPAQPCDCYKRESLRACGWHAITASVGPHAPCPYSGTNPAALFLFRVRAFRPCAPNRQLFLSYGPYPNSKLLLFYGFALTHNPFDCVNITLPVSLGLLHRKAAMAYAPLTTGITPPSVQASRAAPV